MESRLYRAVTGVDLSEAGSYETGDMLNTLERAIQVREGRTRDDDVLHEICYTTEDAGERRYDRQDLEKAKDKSATEDHFPGADTATEPATTDTVPLSENDVGDS